MSAIENNTKTASYDEIATLIENATAISVGPCSCRRSRRLMGEGCGHLEEDMCMYLNDNAINLQQDRRTPPHHQGGSVRGSPARRGQRPCPRGEPVPGFDDVTAICNCLRLLRATRCASPSCSVRRTASAPTSLPASIRRSALPAASAWKTARRTPFVSARRTAPRTPHISDAYDTDRAIPWDKKSYNIDYRTNRSDVMDSGTAPCKAVVSRRMFRFRDT